MLYNRNTRFSGSDPENLRIHFPMRLSLLLSIILLAGNACAQHAPKHLHVFKDRNYLSVPAVDLTDARVLDTAFLVVGYTFSYQKEDWNRFGWVDVPVTLAVGKTWSKFHPDILQQIDEQLTGQSAERALPIVPHAVSPRIGTVYSNADRVVAEHRVPFSDGTLAEYREKPLVSEWRFSDSCTTILGYECRLASATVRGRSWQAWFAPEMPLPGNLWIFRGLPGVVLRAKTDMFEFECTFIRRERIPILQPHAKRMKTTREKWRKFERYYHEMPYRAFNADGSHVFFDGPYKLDENNWTIPYNPIELE